MKKFTKVTALVLLLLICLCSHENYSYWELIEEQAIEVSTWVFYRPWNIVYTDTNWKDFTWIWTITVTDWTKSITILDRNLWANNNWTWENAYWYLFQWWNSYWFSATWDILTSTEQVQSEYIQSHLVWQYWEFISPYFIIWNNAWSVGTISNLWWWDISNSKYYFKKQWPCPLWYHVPTFDEWNELVKLRWSVKWILSTFKDYSGYKYFTNKAFINDFMLPPQWTRNRSDWALTDTWKVTKYWTSTPRGSNATDPRSFAITEWWWVNLDLWMKSWNWMPIRCFANDLPNVVIFDTQGWTEVENQILASWDKATEPKTTKWKFILQWWYGENGTKWDFHNIITNNIILHAKWWCATWYKLSEDEQDCEITENTINFNSQWWTEIQPITWTVLSSRVSMIPNKTWYMFDGRYTDTWYTTEWDLKADSDRTVYAKWLQEHQIECERI